MSDRILVEAQPGRVVQLHRTDAPAGASDFKLRPEDGPLEVPNSINIRRRIRAGDLKIVSAKTVVARTIAHPALPSD